MSRPINVRLPEQLFEKVAMTAKKLDTTITFITVRALEKSLTNFPEGMNAKDEEFNKDIKNLLNSHEVLAAKLEMVLWELKNQPKFQKFTLDGFLSKWISIKWLKPTTRDKPPINQ